MVAHMAPRHVGEVTWRRKRAGAHLGLLHIHHVLLERLCASGVITFWGRGHN